MDHKECIIFMYYLLIVQVALNGNDFTYICGLKVGNNIMYNSCLHFNVYYIIYVIGKLNL